MQQQYSSGGGAAACCAGVTAEEGPIENTLAPVLVLLAVGACSSIVSSKVLNHRRQHATGLHFDPFQTLGIVMLLAMGGGLHYSMIASQPAGISFASMDALMKKPVVVASIVVLAAMLPVVESHLHTVM
jgi:hypothetical protein